MSELRQDGVYIFSTDTVYGLGCALSNQAGIARIFAIKGRRSDKPLAVLVADIAQADELAAWPTPLYREPVAALWPGALTVVVPAQAQVPDLVRAGFPTVGIRCPQHPALQAILRAQGPWVASSVNRSGDAPMNDPDLIRSSFYGEVDGFWFSDPKPNGKASTVLDLTVVPPKLLRAGAMDVAGLIQQFS